MWRKILNKNTKFLEKVTNYILEIRKKEKLKRRLNE